MINQELVTGNEGFKDMISNISIDNCTIDNLLDYKYSQQENTKEIFDFIIKFNKYNFADQKIIVGNDDFEQLIILKSSSTNALFSAYLASLISLNDIGINKIDFYNEMISICKMIIKHYNKAQGYLPYHFFEYFLNCAASKMKLKELKRFFDECYSELLYLVNDNKYVIASLLGMIVSAKATGKISNVEIVKWAEIYLSTLQHDRYQEIQMIECKEEIAELVIPLVKNDKKIQLKLDLAHFLFNHKDIFIFTQKQEKLVKCITLLKNIDDPLEELNEYKIALTESNNETLSQIHEKSIPLPKKVVDLAMEEREKIFTFMEKMSDFSRFIYITFDLDLIKKSLLEYQINIMKKNSVFFSLIPSYHLDRFGNIIKNEQFSIEKREFLDNAVQPFDIILMTYFRDRLDAFLNYFSYDSETDAFLDSVFKNNLICNKTRTTYLKRIVSGILKKEIDTNLRNLISELEDGLRFFFLNHHLSTTEIKGSKVINVDLNTIFNDVTNNKYRMLLLEYIDDDFVFLLEYLMILSPGGNIRNDVMHGIMPPEEMNSYKCWYAALLIIKLYIGFHCCSLEENNI